MNLRNHLFFSFFSDDAKDCLIQSASLTSLLAGELLIREGDPSEELYLLLDGRAAIRKEEEGGRSALIGYIEKNDFVGEFGIIDQAPRSATVEAITNLRVAVIPRQTAIDCLRDSTALFRLTAHTTQRMRIANQRYVKDILQQERIGLLGEMMNGILHDFRNPFAVISMASDCILQSCPDAEIFCEMISQQINRMTSMAEDILDFSSGRTSLDREPVVLSGLFEHFRKLYADYFLQMDVVLKIEPIDERIFGDADKLLRVLQNLTCNAAQAMAISGGTITISAKKEDEQILISVSDNGPGIPEDVQHNLFDAFSTSGKQNGIGIGMAVVQSIIKAHAGSIHFETEAGRGTTFFIRL